MNPNWNQVVDASRLLSLPEVYIRLKKNLEDPDHTLAEVVGIVSKDPVITVRLLRIVNSALYSFSTKIETVGRAITLLGTQHVHDLVLASSVIKAFSDINLEIIDIHRFWRRSLYCAVTCKLLASASLPVRKERLFITGLLHNVGQLIMCQAIPEYSLEAMELAANENIPIHLAERKLLEFDYATVGGFLLSQWNLPEALCEAIEFHLDPDDQAPHSYETAIVHISALMAQAMDDGVEVGEEGLGKIEPAIWQAAHLTAEQCLLLKEDIDTVFQEAVQEFFA